MLTILVSLILLVAAFAVVYWFLQRVALPQPALIVIYALMAIIALYVIFNAFTALPASGALFAS